MREPLVNEIICIVNEGFKLGLIKCIGLHDEDILWTSDNPYTVTLNVYTRNITIYEDGYQVSHLTNRGVLSDRVDINDYEELEDNLYSNISEESIYDIKRGLKKLELFEKYEEASLVKKFLKKVDG